MPISCTVPLAGNADYNNVYKVVSLLLLNILTDKRLRAFHIELCPLSFTDSLNSDQHHYIKAGAVHHRAPVPRGAVPVVKVSQEEHVCNIRGG